MQPRDCEPTMKAAQRAAQLKRRSQRQSNLTLVYGPPCAGKTTYALEHAGPTDVVIDYDLIAQDLGATNTHGHADIHDAVLDELGRRLETSTGASHAWLVKCDPTRGDYTRAARHVLLDPGQDVCLERAARLRPDGWDALIRAWYQRHEHPV